VVFRPHPPSRRLETSPPGPNIDILFDPFLEKTQLRAAANERQLVAEHITIMNPFIVKGHVFAVTVMATEAWALNSASALSTSTLLLFLDYMSKSL
jgi:hypothetical protein